MRLIGLIGQSGAGKSTVGAMLTARGYPVLDGDLLARRVTSTGAPILTRLAEVFGQDILTPGDANSKSSSNSLELNRRLLAKRAFASSEATKKLNSILHPAITSLVLNELEAINGSVAFLEGAALQDSPLAAHCHAFIAVVADENLRLQRIIKRDKLKKEDALLRMSAQRTQDEYCEKADFVIENNDSLELESQLDKILEAIIKQK